MSFNSAKIADDAQKILADVNRISWKEKRRAVFSHFSSFFTYPLALSPLSLEHAALANLALPFLLWLFRRPSYASEQAKEAGLFQIFLAAAFFAISHLKIEINYAFWVFTVIGIALIHLLNFGIVTAMILLAKDFRYPLSPFAWLHGVSQRRKERRLAGLAGTGSVDYLHEVQNKLTELMVGLNKKIKELQDPAIQNGLRSLADKVEAIQRSLQRNPADLTLHRPFFNYYPSATLDILSRYNDLSGHFREEGRETEYRERVMETLSSLDTAFSKFEKNLLSKESLSLETEMAVIQKTLELDGHK